MSDWKEEVHPVLHPSGHPAGYLHSTLAGHVDQTVGGVERFVVVVDELEHTSIEVVVVVALDADPFGLVVLSAAVGKLG